MEPTRLLVVEDHPLFRDGFAAMAAVLRPDWRIDFAASVDEAVAALDRHMADVVVIDVGLRGEDGITLATVLRSMHPDLPTLIMSGRSDPVLQVRAARAGASGFVAKDESAGGIAAAIDEVLRGRRHFAAGGSAPPEVPTLTPRQAEVLALLNEGHGNKEIRHRLGIAERTVRAHLTELFVALGASSRTQALVRARALGLIA